MPEEEPLDQHIDTSAETPANLPDITQTSGISLSLIRGILDPSITFELPHDDSPDVFISFPDRGIPNAGIVGMKMTRTSTGVTISVAAKTDGVWQERGPSENIARTDINTRLRTAVQELRSRVEWNALEQTGRNTMSY